VYLLERGVLSENRRNEEKNIEIERNKRNKKGRKSEQLRREGRTKVSWRN
jgi:hypothetical protein